MSILELKKTAMQLLIRELGELDTELFIRSLLTEAGDYTTWQASFFDKNETVEAFSQKAMQYKNQTKN
jgi:hypothetical protein